MKTIWCDENVYMYMYTNDRYLSIYLYLSIHQFLPDLSIHRSIDPSIYWSIHLSIYRFVSFTFINICTVYISILRICTVYMYIHVHEWGPKMVDRSNQSGVPPALFWRKVTMPPVFVFSPAKARGHVRSENWTLANVINQAKWHELRNYQEIIGCNGDLMQARNSKNLIQYLGASQKTIGPIGLPSTYEQLGYYHDTAKKGGTWAILWGYIPIISKQMTPGTQRPHMYHYGWDVLMQIFRTTRWCISNWIWGWTTCLTPSFDYIFSWWFLKLLK